MTRRQLHWPDRTRSKMRLLRLPHFAQQASISTAQQSRADSPLSIGQRVFKDGTNAQSSTARITPPPCVRSHKHGAKISAISAPRSCLRSFLTKTCSVSVKRLHRLVSSSYCQKFEANAQLIQKS